MGIRLESISGTMTEMSQKYMLSLKVVKIDTKIILLYLLLGGSIVNWLEPKTKTPSGNLACPNL